MSEEGGNGQLAIGNDGQIMSNGKDRKSEFEKSLSTKTVRTRTMMLSYEARMLAVRLSPA